MEWRVLLLSFEEITMNTKQIVAAISLVSLSIVAGCARNDGSRAAVPVGRSTTTGAVLCPQGYVTSTDGHSCVLPEETPQDYEFQPAP